MDLRFVTVCADFNRDDLGVNLTTVGYDTTYALAVPFTLRLVLVLVLGQPAREATALGAHTVHVQAWNPEGNSILDATRPFILDPEGPADPYPDDWPTIAVIDATVPLRVDTYGEYQIAVSIDDGPVTRLRHRVLYREPDLGALGSETSAGK